MPVAWGRYTSPGGLQRQRRFEAVRTRASSITLPPALERLQGVAQSDPPSFLAQLQQQAFRQRPDQVRAPTDVRALALGFAGPQRFETAPQRLARGGQEARSFASSIQGLEPPEITMLKRLAGFSERQGTTPQAVVAAAQAPSIPQGSLSLTSPQATPGERPFSPSESQILTLMGGFSDEEQRALRLVLSKRGMTLVRYLGLSTEDRVFEIGKVKGLQPGAQSGLQLLINREQGVEPSLAPLARAAGGVLQAGRELGAAATTQVRIIAEPLIPGEGEPSLEAQRERGLTGAIERSIDVEVEVFGVPIGPADLLDPLNFIALPIIDPAFARLLSIPVKILARYGGRVTAPILRILGREAGDIAQNSLRADIKAAARQFQNDVGRLLSDAPEPKPDIGGPAAGRAPTGLGVSPEAASRAIPGQVAARDLGAALPAPAGAAPAPAAGLPSTADVVAPTGAVPARAVEPGAAPAVRQAAPAPPEPTVKTRTLEGVDVDTFRTERELGGIREQQGGLRFGEEAVPAPAPENIPRNTLAQLAEERKLAREALASPATKRQKGATAQLRTQIAALDQEERIIRDFAERGLSPQEQADELVQLQLDFAEKDLRTVRGTGGRAAAFGTAERDVADFARRGRRPASQRARTLPAEEGMGDALEGLAERLNLPEPTGDIPAVAGGGSLSERLRALGRLPGEKKDVPKFRSGEIAGDSMNVPESMAQASDVGQAQQIAVQSAEDAGVNASPYAAARTREPRNVLERVQQWLDGTPNDATKLEREVVGEITNEMSKLEAESLRLYERFDAADLHIRATADNQSDEIINVTEGLFDRSDPTVFPPGEKRELLKALYQLLDDGEAMLLSVDPSFERRMLPNYSPHSFKTNAKGVAFKARNASGKMKPGQRPGWMKRRKIKGTLGDILEDNPDLTLFNWDPVDTVVRHQIGVIQYTATHRVLLKMRASGNAILQSQAKKRGLDDWVTPDIPAFRSKAVPTAPRAPSGPVDVTRLQQLAAKEAGRGEAQAALPGVEGTRLTEREGTRLGELRQRTVDLEEPGARPGDITFTEPYVIAPQWAKALNDWYGVSWFDTKASTRVLKRGVTTAFMVKVLGGLFQQWDFTFRSVLGLGVGFQDLNGVRGAARAWSRSASNSVDRRMIKWEASDPVREALRLGGLNIDADPSFVANSLRDIEEEILPIPVLKDIIKFMGGDRYRRFHKEMLYTGGEVLTDYYRKQGLPLNEAGIKAAADANEMFSSVARWQSIFRDPSTRDAVRIFGAFAIGEVEGWARITLRGATTPAGRRFLLMGMMGGTFFTAQALNMLFSTIRDGKPSLLSPEQLLPFRIDTQQIKEFRQEGIGALASLDLPFVDYNTKFLRPELPWRGPGGRKLYLDILGQADTPFRWFFDPVFATQSRLAQIPRLALDLRTVAAGDAPAFGEKVESPLDALKFAAQQVSPISISAFAGTERGRIGLFGAGVQSGGFNVSAEPLREQLARDFEQEVGRPFNPEVDYITARKIPKLARIIERQRKLGVEFASESAVKGEERDNFLRQQEQDIGLVTIANAGLAGDQEALRAFGGAYEDYVATRAAVVARDFFGQDFLEKETPIGKAYTAWVEIRPEFDEETFELDFDGYFAAREEAFEGIRKLDPKLAKALEEPVRTFDPAVQELEARYLPARKLRRELANEISPIQGLSVDQYAFVQEFRSDVTKARKLWEEQGKVVPPGDAIEHLGEKWGLKQTTIDWAIELQSSRFREQARNPEYDAFIFEHLDELSPFFNVLTTQKLRLEAARR